MDDYEDNIPNVSQRIRVINKGKRSYRVVFNRVSTGIQKCSVKKVRAQILVQPKFLLLDPLSESEIIVHAYGCEEASVINSFRVQITDLKDATHVQTSRFTVKATFVYPNINWSKRQVIINYYKTHKFLDHQQWGLYSNFLLFTLVFHTKIKCK